MPNPAIWGDDPVREVIIVAAVLLLVGIFNAWRLAWRPGLLLRAVIKFVLGVLLAGGLIFGTAGTLAFYHGWLFLGVVFVPVLLAGAVMAVKAPDLLEKRLKSKEPQKEQSLVVKLSGLLFLVSFVLAGLNFRLGWYTLPKGVCLTAAGVYLLAYLLYAEVLRENVWLSRTVEVQEGQSVVDTGLYGVVRHPMYTATILLFWSMPLMLGSLYAFFVLLPYPLLLVKRIRQEEELLERELTGYVEYKQKVKYRLVPFVW